MAWPETTQEDSPDGITQFNFYGKTLIDMLISCSRVAAGKGVPSEFIWQHLREMQV